MGEREDHLAVGRTKSAGAIGEVHADQHPDDPAQHEAAELADEGLLVASFLQEPRADDQIGVVVEHALDQAANFRRAVLSVAVDLHGDVISMQGGVAIPRLHCAADAQVERQAYHGDATRHLAHGVVGRPVVHHQDVKLRQRLAKPSDHPANRPRFIEYWYDHQAPRRCHPGASREFVKVRAMHEAALEQRAGSVAEAGHFHEVRYGARQHELAHAQSARKP